MNWDMIEDELQCQMKMNNKTLCIRNTENDTILYVPFFLGMTIDELTKLILLLFPKNNIIVTINYNGKWYTPINNYVLVPFSSTECKIECNVIRVL